MKVVPPSSEQASGITLHMRDGINTGKVGPVRDTESGYGSQLGRTGIRETRFGITYRNRIHFGLFILSRRLRSILIHEA